MSIGLPATQTAGYGVQYASGGQYHHSAERESANNSALSQSVRGTTSRPASILVNQRVDSPTYANGSSNNYAYHPRPTTASSISTDISSVSKEPGNNVKSKLSSESWVKEISTGRESPARPKSRKGRVLKRVDSLERLRRSRIGQISHSKSSMELSRPSKVEPVVTSTPPLPTVSKERLRLTDSSEESIEGAIPPIPQQLRRKASLENLQPQTVQTRPVSRAHILSQSVPRTLPRPTTAQSETPVPEATPRPRPETNASAALSPPYDPAEDPNRVSMFERKAPTIPDHKWADLGEDNETVRRIFELREKRKSRMEESSGSSLHEGLPTPANELRRPTTASGAYNRDSRGTAQVARSSTMRSATTPIKRDGLLAPPSQVATQSNSSSSRQPRSHSRASTAPRSHSPRVSLCLDYSYSKAVDALQASEGGSKIDSIQESENSPPTSSQKKETLLVQRIDVSTPTEQHPVPPAISRLQGKTPRRIATQERLSSRNLSQDLRPGKNRRRSMNDARSTRVFDDVADNSLRDSVDEDVLAYLNNPRMSRTIKHPQTGRKICYSEVGDPNGSAVFVCVGMGLTRYVTAFYDEFATTLRLRLVTIDRPGVGGSEPYPATDRSGPLNWPDDVLAVSQQLGIQKFSLLAHSAGAIYALATALILPNMVKGKIHLLAPWIPPSQLRVTSQMATVSARPAGALPRSQRILRVLPTSFLRAANAPFISVTSASLKPSRPGNGSRSSSRLGERSPNERPATSAERPDLRATDSMALMDQFMPDTNPMESFPMGGGQTKEEVAPPKEEPIVLSATASPLDPEFFFASEALNAAEHSERERKTVFTAQLTKQTWDLATRDSNPVTDLLVCLERHRDIGFRYTDVPREVIITHGSEDKRVPVGNVRWLAEQINIRASSTIATEVPDESLPAHKAGWADVGSAKGGCEVRVLPGEDHGLMASVPIMSSVLTEIAGY